MRRKEREVTDINKIEEIVQKCGVCRIGLIDEGMPYIVPMNFGYMRDGEKLTFYFHCAKEGKKLELMRENPNAAIEMDCSHELISAGDNACGYSYRYASIMGKGVISIEDDSKKAYALNRIMEHMTGRGDFTFTEGEMNKILVLKLEVIALSAKARE
ncbi:MAG: pyridoxamine 5'-phosphate oxidase family protein [Bacillota bacterium]|nr:pyridoxamine 5'-phosphate oxidase family protein [Bacillota bacterium]